MRLSPDAREYAHWTITADVTGLAYEVDFDKTDDWHPLEEADGTYRILVAGPDAEGEGTIPLAIGRHLARIRVVDTPEIVVRDAGPIDVG
ncbi:hypothetical protein GCM10025864_39800 [Luteimicrobium album]|uniref:Uncharacterized protein n=1 Tax=Luteimicrobium album TaxID=1054550 RepID=A0ABQ6I7F7_9MICO|nr:hypothetical protein [Luteimicrobium album]GMA26221.1 hypothetical protein GCM10025864_39800 [Luteimicrobium album]